MRCSRNCGTTLNHAARQCSSSRATALPTGSAWHVGRGSMWSLGCSLRRSGDPVAVRDGWSESRATNGQLTMTGESQQVERTGGPIAWEVIDHVAAWESPAPAVLSHHGLGICSAYWDGWTPSADRPASTGAIRYERPRDEPALGRLPVVARCDGHRRGGGRRRIHRRSVSRRAQISAQWRTRL